MRTHLHRANGASVALDHAGTRVGQIGAPQPDRAVAGGGCDEVALRCNGHTVYTAFVLTEAISPQICLEVPKHDTIVIATAHHLLHIGEKHSAVNGTAVAAKGALERGVNRHGRRGNDCSKRKPRVGKVLCW